MRTCCLLLLALTLLLAGCPERSGENEPATAPVAVAEIPADNPLSVYDKFKLGMTSLEIAQAYPAPDGKGEGYTRLIEEYDAVNNQILQFEPQAKVERRIVLRVFRDKLAKLVDRRDGLTAAEADKWFSELKAAYGEPAIIHPEVQWSWGNAEEVLLTFTRDSAFEDEMSANVVLEHRPTYDMSVEYLRARKTARP